MKQRIEQSARKAFYQGQIEKLRDSARHWAVITLGFITSGRSKVRSRINIENTTMLHQAGFTVGTRFTVKYQQGLVEVTKDNAGTNIISPKAFPKRDGSVSVGERLDLRSSEIHAKFGGEERVLAMYFENRLVFVHLPTVAQQLDRAAWLIQALDKRSLRSAALYAGVGTLEAALHEGFAKAGIRTEVAFANDTWDEAIGCMLNDNPACKSAARTFTGGVEQFVASGVRLDGIDLAVIGIPCKGASRLNLATRDVPELHPVAGHQVLNAAMALVQLGFPPLVLVENVADYVNTASFSMLRRVLTEQGYQTLLVGDTDSNGRYRGLNSTDYGDIERRVRMALLAYPAGMPLSLEGMGKCGPSRRVVGDIRLPEVAIDPAEYAKGLHLSRAEKVGRRWINNVVDDTANVTPSLSASCWKQRVEDPKFRHPLDPTRSRLPTPEEHAALKGHDPRIVNSLVANTHAHTALGNGTTKKCWVELARALGEALLESKHLLQAYVQSYRGYPTPIDKRQGELLFAA